jgi:hypothetical protein
LDLRSLKQDDQVWKSDGPVAEVVEETADGLWIKMRYLENVGPEVDVGAEDRWYRDEVQPMAADDADGGTESLKETVAYGRLIEAAADMLQYGSSKRT